MIHVAVAKGKLTVVRLLLEHQANIAGTVSSYFQSVAWPGIMYPSFCRLGLEKRPYTLQLTCEYEYKCVYMYNQRNTRLLHCRNYYHIAKLLLDRGSDVNEKDNAGHAAIHIATIWGHRRILSLLLSHPKCQIDLLVYTQTHNY